MKELDFMEHINDLDPALLEDAPSPARSGRRSRTLRRIAVAAAAVLLLGGTVFAVASRIELKRTRNPTGEEGVEARSELPLVKWSSFEGEIQNVGEIIVSQYENQKPEPDWSSHRADPGLYTKRFGSIDEAAAWIGLRELKTPGFPFDKYECTASARGNAEGRVEMVQIYAEHIVPNDIGAQETVTILTEYAEDPEMIISSVWSSEFPRDVEFQEYRSPSGLECRIEVTKPQYESNYMGLTAYAATGCAFYMLNLGAVPTEKYDQAVEILHNWADDLG